MTARPDLFVLAASLVVIPSALLLVPTTSDYADLRFRDGEVMQALTDSLGLHGQGTADADAAFVLSRTQIYMGDVDGAASTLEGLIARGADASVLRLTLADLYSSIGRQSEALDLRLAVPPADLGETARRDLASWLRYEGRHDDERVFLDRLNDAGLATPAQDTRLALLMLAEGETDAATDRLRAIDDAGGLTDPQSRLTLLALLIEAGQADQARQRANDWQSGGEGSTFLPAVQRIFGAYELEYETD